MSEKKLRGAVVVAYGRTPYCKANKGSFANVHPVEYGAQALLGVLSRVPQLKAEDIGDVIVGCAMPFGVQGGNMARLIVQRARYRYRPDREPLLLLRPADHRHRRQRHPLRRGGRDRGRRCGDYVHGTHAGGRGRR